MTTNTCYPIEQDQVNTSKRHDLQNNRLSMRKSNTSIFYCVFTLSMILLCRYCYAQGDIEKMKKNVSFYSVKDNRTVFMKIGSKDPIKATSINNNVFRFAISIDSSLEIEVKLKRKWKVISPFWNTFIISDTVYYYPIDTVRLYNNGDTVYLMGEKSAYCGPKRVKNLSSNMKSIWHYRLLP